MIIVCSKNSIYDDFIHNSINEYLSNLSAVYDPHFLNTENLNQNYCLQKHGEIPNVIVILEYTSTPRLVRETYPKSKIIIYTNDLHWFEQKIKFYKSETYEISSYIICYYNLIKTFYGMDKLILNIPHNCCTIFQRSQINEQAEKKIFFYGAIGHHYPERNQFLDKMKKYSSFLVRKNHPGCIFNSSEVAKKITEETSNELNKYFCAFTCGLFPKFEIKEKKEDQYYLIGKHFEIMGNGPLLLCNDYKVRKELETLGFYRNEHYVHIDNDNFHQIIKWLMDDNNSQEILRIRRNGHQKVLNEFTSQVANRRLNEFLVKLDTGEDVSSLVINST
jgi:hypothetical protein